MTALLTVAEAAEMMGVSGTTVRRWIASGLLKPYPKAKQGKAFLYLDTEVYEAEKAARRA